MNQPATVEDNSAYYFAYGSNMAIARLQSRIATVSPVGSATLPGYALRFHKVGQDGSGKCDIVPVHDSDAVVHGVLYRIISRDLAQLDRIEGCGRGYKRIAVAVATERNGLLTAETYVATAIDPGLPVYCWYRQHVLRGAMAAGFPAAYIAAIEAVKCIEDADIARHAREMAIYRR